MMGVSRDGRRLCVTEEACRKERASHRALTGRWGFQAQEAARGSSDRPGRTPGA